MRHSLSFFDERRIGKNYKNSRHRSMMMSMCTSRTRLPSSSVQTQTFLHRKRKNGRETSSKTSKKYSKNCMNAGKKRLLILRSLSHAPRQTSLTSQKRFQRKKYCMMISSQPLISTALELCRFLRKESHQRKTLLTLQHLFLQPSIFLLMMWNPPRTTKKRKDEALFNKKHRL